ncbi:LAME_0E11210g1_1 [Lachancea meyersii CBS 8951]|uniref:LAME_0E11210g1_1 n=1 Tax=Lachancea meyersii CBS 8951 TaxID=1266667 RepID=A0A1G4JKJ8_9SACH|nr:LAME_0E11210g1_1 [Lachancea meyersii CBS 8951]
MARKLGLSVSTLLFIVQFAAMAFLIICCVTAPVFKQIGLAKTGDFVFGTFGYCENGACSSAAANYHPETLATSGDWKLSSSAREKLGKILIIMPVAAGLTFFATLGNFISQFGRLSSSGVCFILNLLLSIIGFAASALMCVITFLLFYPNITWCSWLLIPSAAINLICVPMTFVAHSLASSGEPEGDSDSASGLNVTRLDQDDVLDRYSMDEYKESHKALNGDKPVYPEVYKGPQIVTSSTIHSSTTDSRSDRDAFVRERPNNTAGSGASQTQLAIADPAPDFSFEETTTVTRPYSAIAGSQNVQHFSQEEAAPKPFRAPPQTYRGPSTTSSFYSQTEGELSRQGTLKTTDLRPSSALDLQAAKRGKPDHEELQNIIKGAIHEVEDEEFLKQQTIDPSERPSLDDDDGIKDDDSDFTSVSQRGINQNYMTAINGNGFAHKSPQVAMMPNPRSYGLHEQSPVAKIPHHKYQVVPSQAQRNYAPQPQGMLPQHQYQPYAVHQPVQAHERAAYSRSQRVPNNLHGTSDAILNTSPDFMVAGAPATSTPGSRDPQRGMYAMPPKTATNTTYRPAYKKRLARQNIPAASMARDGPYSGMM